MNLISINIIIGGENMEQSILNQFRLSVQEKGLGLYGLEIYYICLQEKKSSTLLVMKKESG